MKEIAFEWDDAKERTNQRKHGVTFDEAESVFYDEYAMRFDDPDHSDDEERFIMLGMSWKLRALVVCHCFRQDEEVLRIISARRANKREIEIYRQYRR